MKSVRNIVHIDEEKCNGCGLCVSACAEGAIQLVDGKAKLLSEVYCDGLGACLSKCPQDAITIEQREAALFDEKAVEVHLESLSAKPNHKETAKEEFTCPGRAVRTLNPETQTEPASRSSNQAPPQSQLRNWPVQLKLVPTNAPYFSGAKLLIAADCVPFSVADFHETFLAGRILLIGCPKLDDGELYVRKLTEIFASNDIKSVEVVHEEVPCCHGLRQIAERALRDSGKAIPMEAIIVGIDGKIRSREEV